MLLTLFWSTSALLIFQVLAKLTVVMPTSVIVNLGPTAKLGPTTTVALFALGALCMVSCAQMILASFVFNYALVNRRSRRRGRLTQVCHQRHHDTIVSEKTFLSVILVELAIAFLVVSLCPWLMPADIRNAMERMGLVNQCDRYAPVGMRLPLIVRH